MNIIRQKYHVYLEMKMTSADQLSLQVMTVMA